MVVGDVGGLVVVGEVGGLVVVVGGLVVVVVVGEVGGFVVPGDPVLPPSAFLICWSKRPFARYPRQRNVNVVPDNPRPNQELTISLRGIPEHDTAKGCILGPGLLNDVAQRRGVDVARTGSRSGGRSADVDLDVFVGRCFLGPVVPGVKA